MVEERHLGLTTVNLWQLWPSLLPKAFDSTVRWADWWFDFEYVTTVNGWDGSQKLQLRVQVTGHAQKVLHRPPDCVAAFYEAMQDVLKARFLTLSCVVPVTRRSFRPEGKRPTTYPHCSPGMILHQRDCQLLHPHRLPQGSYKEHAIDPPARHWSSRHPPEGRRLETSCYPRSHGLEPVQVALIHP